VLRLLRCLRAELVGAIAACSPMRAEKASHAQVSAADLQRVAKKMLKSPVSVRQSNQTCRTAEPFPILSAETVLNTIRGNPTS
jgi:hypothetical protein